MRTCFGKPSSIKDMRPSRSLSSGNFFSTDCIKILEKHQQARASGTLVSLTSSKCEINGQKPIVARKNHASTHDIIDYLQVPRKQVLHQRDGPLLESFWKDGMVGKEECVGDDIPGLVPRNLFLINENTHEFRNSESRVGIVELNGGI